MRFSRFALAALALPLVAGCSSLVDNQKMGPQGTPAGGAMFRTYVALGTSISAGVQSGGLSDSTQRRSFPYLLAQAMGLAPNTNWFYPGFTMPGCPPPYTNPLTGARVGTGSTASTCYLVSPISVPPRQNYYNNLGVPSMRVGQALHISQLLVPATDTLQAAQFITGSRNPVDLLAEAKPTFVTIELGANDALHAATSGDTTLLTPLATFQAQYDTLATLVAATGADVAVATVPNVSNIPYLTKGHIFFCAKTGLCGAPAQLPFSLATFTVDPSCAPSAAGGIGDKMAVGLPATAKIAGTLAGGGAASLNCLAGTATVTTTATAPVGPIVSVSAMATIIARVTAFNTAIKAEATTHGWALANIDSALTVLVTADSIPVIPNLAGTGPLFGTFVSLDGFHPSNAGNKLIADLFVGAIYAKYGIALTPP